VLREERGGGQPRDLGLQLIDLDQQRRDRLGDQLTNIVFAKTLGHASFITHAPRPRNASSSKSVNGCLPT